MYREEANFTVSTISSMVLLKTYQEMATGVGLGRPRGRQGDVRCQVRCRHRQVVMVVVVGRHQRLRMMQHARRDIPGSHLCRYWARRRRRPRLARTRLVSGSVALEAPLALPFILPPVLETVQCHLGPVAPRERWNGGTSGIATIDMLLL